MHSCKLMLLGQKSMCCKCQLVSEGSRHTWGSDPSPGLFPDMETPVGKPWQCKTEVNNATFNSCDFELMFPPCPKGHWKLPKQRTGLSLHCSCWRKVLLAFSSLLSPLSFLLSSLSSLLPPLSFFSPSSPVYNWDDSSIQINTPGRAKRILWRSYLIINTVLMFH